MDKFVKDIRLEQWIPILEAQARSGLCKQDFCKQHGISRGLFFKWQRILREKIAEGFDPSSISSSGMTNKITENARNDESVFYEITPASPCSLAENNNSIENHMQTSNTFGLCTNYGISISYGGFSIKLSGPVDETSLTSVLKAVKHA